MVAVLQDRKRETKMMCIWRLLAELARRDWCKQIPQNAATLAI